MGVVLSDEEIEAQRRARLEPAILVESERAAIDAEFASLAQEREENRQRQQAHYDSGKGKAARQMFREPLPAADRAKGES